MSRPTATKSRAPSAPGLCYRNQFLVAVFTLILLTTCLDTCQAAAPPTQRSDAQSNKVKLLRYVQRVSTVMEDLMGTKDDRALATTPIAARTRSPVVEAAKHPSQGLSPEQVALAASTSALPDWLHAPRRWLEETRGTVHDSVARVSRLLHVAAGGALSEEEEATLQQRLSSTAGTSNALSSGRILSKSARTPVPDVLLQAASSSSSSPSARAAFSLTNDARRDAGLTASNRTDLFDACFNGGKLLLSSTSTVRCRPTGSDEVVTLTALEYSLGTDYAECQLATGTGVACLCPPGTFIQLTARTGLHTCQEREINVVPHLPESQLCHDAVAARVGLPSTRPDEYCITTTRQATLTLDVTWFYELASATNVSDTFITPSSDTDEYVVVGTDTVGTLDELRETLFVSELWDPQSSLKIVQTHALFGNAEAFTQIYCFSSPASAVPYRQSTELNTSTAAPFLGGANGTTTHVVTIDLSTVEDKMIEGNQLYIETGVRGTLVRNRYRVSRLHVRFSDLALPAAQYHYSRPMNVLYVALIVLVCLVVLIIVLVVLWCVCTRESPEEDDEVSRTVRKREERKHMSTASKKKT